MKRTLTIVSALLTLAGLLHLSTTEVSAQPGRAGKPKAAVLFFDNTGKAPTSISELEALIAWLTIVPNSTVERKLRSENVKLSGDIDPSTAVRIGKLLGVNYLIFNKVVNASYSEPTSSTRKLQVELATSLIDTSTGEVVWIDNSTHSGKASCVCDLAEMLGVIARAGLNANMFKINGLPPSGRTATRQ